MHELLVDGLEKRGVAKLPAGVELAVGLPAAKKLLGADRIKEIQAPSPFNKRSRRSDWAPYVVPHNGKWVVTCPDPAALPKMGWMSSPAIDAALDHVKYLADNKLPWQPPDIVYDPRDFDVPKTGVIGIDLEGSHGTIDRLGLSTDIQTLTCQWDIRAEHLLRELIMNTSLEFVAHNAPFDSYGVEQTLGVRFRPHCTMVATRLINPWRRIGLGHAAPLYIPGLSPWKHKGGTDAEAYNAWDVAVLQPMWKVHKTTIYDHHMERAYAEDLVAEYAAADWSLDMEDRLQHSVNWVETPVTRASGIIESKRQGTIDGLGFQHSVPIGDILVGAVGAEYVMPLECNVTWNPHVIFRHVLGYGPRQIRNGGAEFPRGVEGLPDTCKDKCIKEITDAFDAANPAFVAWRDRLRRQARKDGYVTALDGRRMYGCRGGEAQRFVIFAEIGRRLKATLPFKPRYINHEVVVAAQADDRILAALRGE